MSGSVNSILSNAASGLNAAQAGITVISNNIANAGVTGYTAKNLDLSTFMAGSQASGVRTGAVTRSVDAAVQASLWSSASAVGALTVRSQVLNAVNATQGTPGAGNSLADAVSALQSSFNLLQSQPSNMTQQQAVVTAASTLATTINNTANAVNSQINGVQTQLVSAVSELNYAMVTVQTTTQELVGAVSANQNTADLEDQRDTALQTLSSLLSLNYDKQANGNITILGQNGLSIPLDSQFSVVTSVSGPSVSQSITMQSSDPGIPQQNVTGLLSGGQIGELIQQSDTTLPAYTAQLNAFSASLANQFSAVGLQLFTNGTSTTLPVNNVGLASAIEVNPNVTPSMVRDGTGTPNANTSNTAGFTGIIDAVLTTSFAPIVGPNGKTTPGVGDQAQAFVSQQSADTAQATSDLASATSYQTTVASRFSDASGVNVDNEMGLMIQLQNSYQANARVVQTAQAMFTTLLNATTTNGL